MSGKATRKYLTAKCATCGRRLRADAGSYVFSRFTGNHYCIPCAVRPTKKGRQ